MPSLLRRHPQAAVLGLAIAVVAGSALLVLPRLDAIEIVSALSTRDGTTGAPARGITPAPGLDVTVRYRLTAPAGGAVRVRVALPGGREATARRELAAGSGTATLRLDVPRGAQGVVIAELVPSAERLVLEPLLAGRRRAAAGFGR